VALPALDRQLNVTRLRLASALILLAACSPIYGAHTNTHARATSPCHRPNETSQILIQRYKWLATTIESTTVADRQAKGLPAIPSSEVALVADSAVCRLAVRAFNYAFAPDSASTTEVHVIRFGPTRYVVIDESRRAGEWLYRAVFDSTFVMVMSRGRE
jgi:hypothetical protein